LEEFGRIGGDLGIIPNKRKKKEEIAGERAGRSSWEGGGCSGDAFTQGVLINIAEKVFVHRPKRGEGCRCGDEREKREVGMRVQQKTGSGLNDEFGFFDGGGRENAASIKLRGGGRGGLEGFRGS